MSFHSVASLGARHPLHNYSYATAAARLAATGFVTADVGKVALQTSDNSLWALADESPITWDRVSGEAPQTAVDAIIHPWLGGGNSGTYTILTTLGMFLYWNPERATFNRMSVYASSWTTPGTLAFGVYQATDRNIRSVANRIASATAQNPGASPATVTMTPSEGSVTIEPGWVWIVYGRDSATGAVQLSVVQGPSARLHNVSVISGTTPIGIETALAASSGLPSTLDPSAYTAALSGNVQPYVRLHTV